ncbi:hypothetical protein [Defluviimonas sp. WL0075]|uniref:Uncharacterized protein n=1 Tax=Albidovulum sediminicola TaxID=2984331 RepID=A0ABT2Z728_9RHOB|nr:hypothetical protein [Defluviimonas sp. WL0075]MCV2866898.1 hypothetical protein [Defluviimonas sp. WL0075]
MTLKTYDRDDLKRACLAALDAVAVEHPAGHQGKLAARYVLHTPRGAAIEIMFEKGPKTLANLWMNREAGEGMINAGIRYRLSPAVDTYVTADDEGRPRYGRHSALKPMRQLANADLICFTIERPGEIKQLLEHLQAH